MKAARWAALVLVLLVGGSGTAAAPAEGDDARRERLALRGRVLDAIEYLLAEVERHASE